MSCLVYHGEVFCSTDFSKIWHVHRIRTCYACSIAVVVPLPNRVSMSSHPRVGWRLVGLGQGSPNRSMGKKTALDGNGNRRFIGNKTDRFDQIKLKNSSTGLPLQNCW